MCLPAPLSFIRYSQGEPKQQQVLHPYLGEEEEEQEEENDENEEEEEDEGGKIVELRLVPPDSAQCEQT